MDYKRICNLIVQNIFETSMGKIIKSFVNFFKENFKCDGINIIISRNNILYIYKEFDIPDYYIKGIKSGDVEIDGKRVFIYKYFEKDTGYEIMISMMNCKEYNIDGIEILTNALLQLYKKNYVYFKDLEELEAHISYTTDRIVSLRKSIDRILEFAQSIINSIIYRKDVEIYFPMDKVLFLKDILKEISFIYIYINLDGKKNVLHYNFVDESYKKEDTKLNNLIEECSIENKIVYKENVENIPQVLIYKRRMDGKSFISIVLGFKDELKEREIANLLINFFAIFFELEIIYRKYLYNLSKLNELKTFLVNNIAHEILTPITIAKDLLKISLEEKDHKRKDYLIERAYNAILRLKNITEKVVKFVEIFRGRDVFEFEEINLNDIIIIVLKEYEAIIKERKITVEMNLRNIPNILGNYSMLKLAIRELVDNAIKFNKIGGMVKLETYEDGENIFFKISDTGIGMKREDIERIFDLFLQLEKYETKKHPGIGIGLILVKTIIEYHNGSISIKSEPETGTEVTVSLPKRIRIENISQEEKFV